MNSRLYKTNKAEREILDRARNGDIDLFMDFYFRSAYSGTWWLPGTKAEHWKKGYQKLFKEWESLNRPEDKFISKWDENMYSVVWSHEKSREFPDVPAFHQNHGLLMLDWQKQLHADRTPIRVVVGGFGSGKTLSAVLSFLIFAATLPGYRGLALAPFSKQASEVYTLALNAVRGTEYEKRFLIRAPSSPFPTLVVGSDYTGSENTIECYGIGEKDNVDKLRTITADNALIDQSEKIVDLKSVVRDVGTRFRGRELSSGRGRIGTLTFLANSEHNDELWQMYDMAEEDPETYLAMSPSTYDNIHLTDADIARYEKQVGESDEDKRVYLRGGRPLGDGSQFSRVIMERVRSIELDDRMADLASRNIQGARKGEMRGVGVNEWMLPYDPDRQYLVVSDPGTDCPPRRNSPVILVWDITHFSAEHPMTLAGYLWFNGRSDIQTWANRYAETVRYYNAFTRNGFDATGYQAGYDQWITILHGLLPERIEITQSRKSQMLNDAKVLCSNGLVKMPVAISGIYNQLARYEYPEKPQAKQDLVVTFMMSCWWVKRLFYVKLDTIKWGEPELSIQDRYYREVDDRYERQTWE